jgi:hypothetical protein
MNLTEFEKVLTEYRGNFTPQSWKRFDYKYENEYLKIIVIDCSNMTGGESVDSGKQWGIIFEKK